MQSRILIYGGLHKISRQGVAERVCHERKGGLILCAEEPEGSPDHTGVGGHGIQMGSRSEKGMEERGGNSIPCISAEASRPGPGQGQGAGDS